MEGNNTRDLVALLLQHSYELQDTVKALNEEIGELHERVYELERREVERHYATLNRLIRNGIDPHPAPKPEPEPTPEPEVVWEYGKKK